VTPKEAAQWANMAYESTGWEEAESQGFSPVLFAKGPHQCLVGNKQGQTFVAFRGTEFSKGRFDDVWTNLQSRQVRCRGADGHVHKGYHDGVWALLPALRPMLKGEVYLTGHSMGAAMATIAGAIIRPKAVYAFNSPKCGNQVFAKKYPTTIYRFVSIRDFAQSYPSDTKDWAHVGSKIQLPSKGHSIDKILKVWI